MSYINDLGTFVTELSTYFMHYFDCLNDSQWLRYERRDFCFFSFFFKFKTLYNLKTHDLSLYMNATKAN